MTENARSRRRIVSILEKNVDELTDADYDHMRKVIGYVSRHREQQPKDATTPDGDARS